MKKVNHPMKHSGPTRPRGVRPEQSSHNTAKEDREFKRRLTAKAGYKKNQIYHPGA